MKKPISLILALLICLTLCPVTARAEGETSEPQTFNSEGYYCTLLADGTAEITWYYGRESNLCIPDVLDGIPVTHWEEKSFRHHPIRRQDIFRMLQSGNCYDSRQHYLYWNPSILFL